MRWTGHVAGTVKSKERARNPRRNWKKTIKMYVRELGWEVPTQDKEGGGLL
jgi:hypothetical protein